MSDEKIPPGKALEESYFSHLDAMPDGFASDFPLYSTTVVYAQYFKRPDEKEITEIKLKIESGELPPDYSTSNIKIYQSLLIQHRYTGTTPQNIRKWYEINAFNAGYREITYEEGAMLENFNIRYEKREDNILKRVIVYINPEKIDLIVFEDTEIEKHPDYMSDHSNIQSQAGQTAEPENN
jgi:hypothetical protein